MIEKYSRVYATVDLDAIRFNMEQMHGNLAAGTKMIGVIKTDGYGHGAVPIARELEALDYMYGFAVATVEEAMILRECGIRKPLLILGYTFPYSYEEMIRHEIRPVVFRYDMLEELSECACRIGKKAMVHVAVDTGMSRIGIRPDKEGEAFVRHLLELPGICLEGMMTHFAKADEADKAPTKKQLEAFRTFIQTIEARMNRRIPLCHCSNSAGIVEIKDANMDAVRAGITMYGLWPSQAVARDIVELHPVMELKSCIVYVKEIESGTRVSYGGTYTADHRMKIATVPVGYGDGYPRGLSNKGFVLVHGKRAPVIGRICMDQFMIDVTHIPEAAEGDEVTLIGADGGEQITMEELGERSGRFNYELACGIGKRVPRIYLKSGKVTETKDYFHDFR